jgi:hypothetical protein
MRKTITIVLLMLLALLIVFYTFRQLSWSQPAPQAADRLAITGRIVSVSINEAGYLS